MNIQYNRRDLIQALTWLLHGLYINPHERSSSQSYNLGDLHNIRTLNSVSLEYNNA